MKLRMSGVFSGGTPLEPVAPHSDKAEAGDRATLFFTSFLALFLELAFIRYVPAHVRVVGYFTNLVLIASFLGLGIGFLISGRTQRSERILLPLICLTLLASWILSEVLVANAPGTQEPLWLLADRGRWKSFEMSIGQVVLILYVLITITMVPMGQVMGRLFGRLPRLSAYALDLGGSLCGVLVFGLLSALETTPMIWFVLAVAVIVIFLSRGSKEKLINAMFAAVLIFLVRFSSPSPEIWSPYYRIEIGKISKSETVIMVNTTLHQVMMDFGADTERVQKTKLRFEIPYRAASSLKDVLIVGAGTGNDVAIALLMGAAHVDAVEIDPEFPRIGKALHASAPYDSDRVTVHVTDARAYFKNCRKRYDLIVFGTLDSQALMGHLSSIRLDNYVYTVQSFEEAYRLLKPDGIMAVFHMSLATHIWQRIALLAEKAGGKPPQTYYFRDSTLFNFLFMQGRSLSVRQEDRLFMSGIKDRRMPTDDWPFLYLQKPGIPRHYGTVLLGMVLCALLGIGLSARGRLRNFDVRLFLLGAGFLLLETKSVTQMSLLFGSTWQVNLLVFSSILFTLFCANALVIFWQRRKTSIDLRLLFAALVASLMVLFFVPVSWVAGQEEWVRWVLGGTLVGLPIGLAGLIFPLMFSRAKDPQIGFASNLLGAIVGGCMEYSAMLFGVPSLAVIAAAIYIVAAPWKK